MLYASITFNPCALCAAVASLLTGRNSLRVHARGKPARAQRRDARAPELDGGGLALAAHRTGLRRARGRRPPARPPARRFQR